MIKKIIIALSVVLAFSACETKTLNYAKTFPKSVEIVADELTHGMGITGDKIVFTSLVDLNDFKESSNFGRLFSESLMTQMALRNYNVIEYRGDAVVSKINKGEFRLNRARIQKLDDKNILILIGTYSKMDDSVIVNVRILNRDTNILVSAASVYIPIKETKRPQIIKKSSHLVQLVPADCSKGDYCWKDINE